jgi:transcriptional regulator with XRE-family HTH domain
MPSVERARHRGQRHAERLAHQLGAELRNARLASGLSQLHVARSAGLSRPVVGRAESPRTVPSTIEDLAVHCAVLGLRLAISTFPDGSPVRDAGQLRLIERLRDVVGPGLAWSAEAVFKSGGDLRAWDVRLDSERSLGVDAETRIYDIQALQRKLGLKKRDSGVHAVMLLVARSNHNRRVLRLHREAMRDLLPADGAELLPALRRGRVPARSGILML